MFTSEGAWQDFVTLLERLALSPEEGAILTSIGYGILRLDLLPQITATESQKAGPFGSLSEAEAQTGLSSCFSKGWLRIVDEKALDEMRSLLREQGVPGPGPDRVVAPELEAAAGLVRSGAIADRAADAAGGLE